jgi:hypothetical protein
VLGNVNPQSTDTPDAGIAALGPWPLTRLLQWTLLVILVGMYALLAPQTARHEDKDWTHLWLAGRMVVEGHAAQMYDPQLQVEVHRRTDAKGRPPRVWNGRYNVLGCFNYPPPTALLYALLAWLPMSTAAVVNAFATIALALVVSWMLARTLGAPASGVVVAIAVLAYPPFFINLSVGQNAVVTMAVLAGAWCLCSARRDLWGGLLLGLLVCKPNWLLAVAWIPLVHRRWRVLGGIALGATLAIAVTIILVGREPFHDYAQLFRKVALLHDLPGYHLDLKYNALGLFRKWLGMGQMADLLGWGSAAVLILATWRVTRGCWNPAAPGVFHTMMACSLSAALWVNPHLNYYDLMVTALCAVALATEGSRLGFTTRWIAVAVLAFVYLAVPWDQAWSWRRMFPVPSFAILVLWAWLAWRMVSARRASQPAGPSTSTVSFDRQPDGVGTRGANLPVGA